MQRDAADQAGKSESTQRDILRSFAISSEARTDLSTSKAHARSRHAASCAEGPVHSSPASTYASPSSGSSRSSRSSSPSNVLGSRARGCAGASDGRPSSVNEVRRHPLATRARFVRAAAFRPRFFDVRAARTSRGSIRSRADAESPPFATTTAARARRSSARADSAEAE